MATSNHPSAATMMKSSSAILMLAVVGGVLQGTSSVPIKPCVPKSTCSCVNADGLIDLHPLGNNDGTPRFRDIPDPDGKTFYSWNPCYGFDEAGCRDVAMCQIKDNGATSQSLGNQSSLVFVASSLYGQVYQYTNWGGANFSGNVILTCDAGEEGVVTRRPDADFLSEFYLELRSKYACPQKINASTSFQPTVSTTRRQRPTTPAFIGTAKTPSPPTTTMEPLFDMNSLGALMIVVLAVLTLLVTVMLMMISYIFFRLGNGTTTPASPTHDYGSNSSSKVSDKQRLVTP
ncbi:uncharacterized protein LOC124260995 isoform X2 [Haliotis rubra]|uniref:uncharacterized protein LOC124260995 isoform X2 n=1 Tax=Haliotis rubra TaxID=36100 RepID=UPI001EE5E165|nr:uncharacterized protein LOC124260995 isoform X2 [Haliotis rubra]